MPTLKQDFVWLLKDYLDDIKRLPERFPLRDFNFMITSQRTMGQIYRKMEKIDQGKITGREHANFWPDLRALGLVAQNRQELSELGKAALQYFYKAKDDFKREHFILSSIRQKTYDAPNRVRKAYLAKRQNLHDYLKRIPPLNKEGQEILRDEEKLFFTECLNTFPLALKKYFDLPRSRQKRLDSLHESGLKTLFDPKKPEEAPYAKVARRFLNVWRALNRRTNFVKSVVLSHYEEKVKRSPEHRVKVRMDKPYTNILNRKLLASIIEKSGRIFVEEEGKWILEKVKRARRARVITDPNVLTRQKWLKEATKRISKLPDAEEREQARLTLLEKRRSGHQEIVKTIITKLYAVKEGCIMKEDPYSFDLLVEKKGQAFLHEMKTIRRYDRADERRQIIQAVGQLFYYEHFDVPFELDDTSANVTKFVVFQNMPYSDHVVYLKNCGVEVLWLKNGRIDGDPVSLELVKRFISDP